MNLVARILEDRLSPWQERLRNFDLQAAPLVAPDRAGGPDCPWLAHLRPYHAWLGGALFAELCAAQAVVWQGFWRQKGARILDRGLKAGDALQSFALQVVGEVWGSIDRAHSQEYCDRGATKIVHSGTLSEYTPPSCGPIKSSYWTGLGVSEERATADIERVVRVGLVNSSAVFDAEHLPLYHGLAANAFDGWAKSGANFQAYPGKFGEGVYLTPSFQMACMYAFRTPKTVASLADNNLAAPRFASTPDGRWNYLICLQVMADAKAVTKFAGTAFTDAGDGWDLEAQISVVRSAAEAQIYGVLFCFFPQTFKD